jgi:hypothetical protein
VNAQTSQEKRAEVAAVSIFASRSIGRKIRIPIEWERIAAEIRHELQRLGWSELANDMTIERDGIMMRWTRLEVKDISGCEFTFALVQTLAQKAKEETA